MSASGWSLQVSQSEATAALAVAEAFLVEKGVRGRVLMCRLTGSTAYGLAHAKSDKDYVGIASYYFYRIIRALLDRNISERRSSSTFGFELSRLQGSQ